MTEITHLDTLDDYYASSQQIVVAIARSLDYQILRLFGKTLLVAVLGGRETFFDSGVTFFDSGVVWQVSSLLDITTGCLVHFGGCGIRRLLQTVSSSANRRRSAVWQVSSLLDITTGCLVHFGGCGIRACCKPLLQIVQIAAIICRSAFT